MRAGQVGTSSSEHYSSPGTTKNNEALLALTRTANALCAGTPVATTAQCENQNPKVGQEGNSMRDDALF